MPTLFFYIILYCFRRTFSDFCSVRNIHTAHTGLCGKLDKVRTGCFRAVVTHTASKFQRRFSLRCVIMKAGQRRTANQLAAVCTFHWEEIGRQTVSVGNRTSFIKNHGIHITAGFYCFTGHGDYIEASHSIHTCNPDSGKQTANGRRDQANSQGNQRGNLKLNAGIYCHRIKGNDHN